MKSIKYIICCFVALSLLVGCTKKTNQSEISAQEYLASRVKLESGQPAVDQIQELYDEMDFQRAVQAYIWAIPFVSFAAFERGWKEDFGESMSRRVVFETSATQELKVYTANNTTIYTAGFFDLKKHGPVVLDVPPVTLGGINNHWQYPLQDIGPFGPDKGEGGKYLILPPNYEGDVPAGYHVVQADTYKVLYLLRGVPKGADTSFAIATIKNIQTYPLSQAANPPKTEYFNVSGKVASTIFPTDETYFDVLAKEIQYEIVRPQDKAILGMLAPMGIEHGKAFSPDARVKGILKRAAKVGDAMSRVIAYNSRNVNRVHQEGNYWERIFLTKSPTFETDNYLDVDARVTCLHQAFFTANAQVFKIVGKGSQYLATYKDSRGEWLDGNHNYRLHLNANMPAKNFWSVMVYDTEDRSMIVNGLRSGIDQYTDLDMNVDGSVDLYFGPLAPKGHEKNWIKTNNDEGFFLYFRAYGPTESFFDGSYKLNDVEKIK
jgi:hypothetical protein